MKCGTEKYTPKVVTELKTSSYLSKQILLNTKLKQIYWNTWREKTTWKTKT